MENVDKRSEEVFSSVIGAFIDTGAPIGSDKISGMLSRKFSPALIRCIMNDLEKKGLLTHRHASGGRVPTDKGFRYYVDRLLKVEPLSRDKVSGIVAEYDDSAYNITDIMKKTSRILSELSSYAGLILTPLKGDILIKQLEFIRLNSDRILGIFVGCNGLVENRIIKVNVELTYAELEKINNYCNRAFYGLSLAEAEKKVAVEMETAMQEYENTVSRALVLSRNMFIDLGTNELFVDGGSQLLCNPEFSVSDKAVSLMDALEEKLRLIDLLNNAMLSERINVFIGSESGFDAISDCSIVTSAYEKDGKILGTLGVIGPTRMNYSKVVPIVECTGRVISAFLNGREVYDD